MNHETDLEGRILALAAKRGLVKGPLENITPLASEEAGSDTPKWGLRLDGLIRSGAIGQDQVRDLALEAMQGAALDGTDASALPMPVCPDSWLVPSPQSDSGHGELPEVPDSDRFTHLSLLAIGGTARIYRAQDQVLQRAVALKFLRDDLQGSGEAILREARAQARVEHPNVCKVYEVGELDGQPYIAMQLVLGSTLSQVGQALLLRDKVEAMRDVADAVHVAHRQGLIHLDLKPGNILMEPKESGGFRPLVTDFGLYMREGAQVGELFQQRWLPLGTPPYSSPEQLSASWKELDRRSDVYAMGVVLHWLISGRTPYGVSDPKELRARLLGGDPPPLQRVCPGVPDDLCAIIHRAMARAKTDRYPSAAALAEDLQRFLDGEPVHAKALTLRYRFGAWGRRNRKLAWALAALVLLALGSSGWSIWFSYRARTWARLSASYEKWISDTFTATVDLTKPLHDIRRSRDWVLNHMRNIEGHLHSDGKLAEAPICLVLGRICLDQGFSERGQGYLERAERAGFNGEETTIFLGMTLTARYLEGIDGCALLPASEREARIRELDRRFRLPALVQIRRYMEQGNQGAVVLMHEAILTGQVDKAQEIFNKWREQTPEVDSYAAIIGAAQVLRISRVQALADPASVREALKIRRDMNVQVLAAFPSNSLVYMDLAACDFLEANLLEVGTLRGTELLRAALAQCALGLKAEPDQPRLVLLAAEIHQELGERAEAVSGAQAALDLLPKWEHFLGPETTEGLRAEAEKTLREPAL